MLFLPTFSSTSSKADVDDSNVLSGLIVAVDLGLFDALDNVDASVDLAKDGMLAV